MPPNSGAYPMTTGNNGTLTIQEFSSAKVVRPLYQDNRSPYFQFENSTTKINLPGAVGTANMTGYTMNGQAGVLGALTGPMLNFTNGFVLGDQMYGTTTNPTDEFKFMGDQAVNTPGPGFIYQIWNANTNAYTQVFDVIGSLESKTTAAGGPYSLITQNFGSTAGTLGMTLNNSLQLLDLSNPTAPTVTPTIASGGASTTYSYAIVAYQADGGHTAVSPAGTTAVGPDSLSATNFNTITWSSVSGAEAYYNVYRTAGGTSTGLINPTPIPATGVLSFVDNGLTASGSAPTINNSGCLLIGTTSTTTACGGKVDIIGDTGTIRAQTTGTTLEFTAAGSSLQADATSFNFAVGGSTTTWSMKSDGGLTDTTSGYIQALGLQISPTVATSSTTVATNKSVYICSGGSLTLPATPAAGDILVAVNVGTGSCSVAGNGYGIGNVTSAIPTSLSLAAKESGMLLFDSASATQAWRIVSRYVSTQ
jgi:hypothetical protein